MLSLTLTDELVRGQVPEQAVRPTLIVIYAPGINDGLGMSERGDLVHVQTLVSQSSIRPLNEGIFHGFARPNKIQLNASAIRPLLQRP